MKPDDTQRNAHDIDMQRVLGNIQPMDINSINQLSSGVLPMSVWPLRTLFLALLLGAGAVHANEPKKVSSEQRMVKPYGSGYETRGLGAPKDLPVETDRSSVSGSTIQRSGLSGSSHSGGGSNGSGGSGGSGRR